MMVPFAATLTTAALNDEANQKLQEFRATTVEQSFVEAVCRCYLNIVEATDYDDKTRKAIMEERPTPLSTALAFLHRDMEPRFYYWELVEVWRKLFLIGFAMIIAKGSVYQLCVALGFSLIYMLVVSITQPYLRQDNDYFALACNFAITAVFFFSLIIKAARTTAQCTRPQLMHARIPLKPPTLCRGPLLAAP